MAHLVVRVAQNGKEALEFLQREQGWVVLLDVNMPQLGGLEVAIQLNDHPAWLDHHRVVLMSAGRHLAAAQQPPVSEVISTVILKPFELETILDVVEQVAAEQESSSSR